MRSASEPVQLTLQGLQAQLNDVLIAVSAARALAAANNASVLKALEKPNAWIKAARAQLEAANVRGEEEEWGGRPHLKRNGEGRPHLPQRRHATTRSPWPSSAGDCTGL